MHEASRVTSAVSLMALAASALASAQTLEPLHNFAVSVGSNDLTVANGAIVGLTIDVSDTQGAEFYQLVPPAEKGASWTQAILYQFAVTDGRPNAGLIAGSHGEYYGTTASGGAYNVGQVFELAPPAQQGQA